MKPEVFLAQTIIKNAGAERVRMIADAEVVWRERDRLIDNRGESEEIAELAQLARLLESRASALYGIANGPLWSLAYDDCGCGLAYAGGDIYDVICPRCRIEKRLRRIIRGDEIPY